MDSTPSTTPDSGSPDEHSLTRAIEKLLDTLTYREREITKLRFGLGDGFTYTREEVGRIFKVTADRVKEIEKKAIRKLQHPARSRQLKAHFDQIRFEGLTEPEHYLLQAIFGKHIAFRPNIFEFATNERWQDAFIAWLIQWADRERRVFDEPLHKTGSFLLNRLLALHQLGPCDEFWDIETYKYRHIDLIVTLNHEFVVLIEDKIDYSEHDAQLERYLEIARADFPKYTPVPVYFKTGNQFSFRDVIDAGWKCFLRKDFLEVLEYGLVVGVQNDIFRDFHLRLRWKHTLCQRSDLSEYLPETVRSAEEGRIEESQPDGQ
jgi:hypothetical protein